ncbi:MAG: transcription antitermination protein NusB [Bacteroidia bacterium]|nr:transcription antitermination protein NusB [Bacteroidia bacterium]
MLSRRQLRVRVLQALYAFFQQENGDVWIAQKELLASAERVYDLYLQLLNLLPEMAHHETMYIKDAPKKHIAKSNEIVNKLDENIIVKYLNSNLGFNDKLKKRGLSWSKDTDLLSRIFLSFRMSDEYLQYISDKELTVKKQVDFVIHFYNQHIFTNEAFTHEMEDKNVFWAESFELISQMVIKSVTDFDEKNASLEIMPMYRDKDDDIDFMRKLFSETIKHNEWFTQLIADKTKNWEVERIAIMDVIMLKMALAEVTCFESIPVKVTINEYLDISKVYSTPKSKVFINGIIDKLVVDLKQTDKIQKRGRGLIDK